MPKRFKKIIPSNKTIRENRVLKPISHLLGDPRIWYFNRRTVASGFAIGILFGFLPIPVQMLLSAAVAIITRVNLPIAVVTTWVSNPLTYPFIFTANYYFGCFVLGIDRVSFEAEFSLNKMLELGGQILLPLFFGSVLLGLLVATISFIAIKLWWRYTVSQYYLKRRNRYKKAKEAEEK